MLFSSSCENVIVASFNSFAFLGISVKLDTILESVSAYVSLVGLNSGTRIFIFSPSVV